MRHEETDQASLTLDSEHDEVVLRLPDPLFVLLMKGGARAQAPPPGERVQLTIDGPAIQRIDVRHIKRT